MDQPAIRHCPVLIDQLRQQLEVGPDSIVVDATIGSAGHAIALAEHLGNKGCLIGLDVDECCLETAREKLEKQQCQVYLINENFSELDKVLSELGLGQVNIILADLGVNSVQLANADQGISFQVDGPLDMRLDNRLQTTAGDLINGLPEEKLADLIWRWGEERHSRRIARLIVKVRREKPFERTLELVSVINKSLGITGKGRKNKIHPATRTFQALRIAVNHEIDNLERLLKIGPDLLKKGGQIAIISFHSLEDRLVKWNFRENKQLGQYEILTKKPIVAEQQEKQENPRSRSAKLRIAKRL